MSTNQTGPTPNYTVVNPDGTPTRYFFAFLGALRAGALAAADLEILESFADKSDAPAAPDPDLFPNLLPGPSTEIAALLEAQIDCIFGAATYPIDRDELLIAALIGDRAPAPAGFPVGRDVIANIPSGFNAGDDGRRFYATDYQHWYRWNGAGGAWAYDDGEEGSGRIAYFAQAPRAGKWQLCDGSTGISESLANGSAALVQFSGLAAGTMPDLCSTPTFLRSNSTCTGVVMAGSGGTFTGTPATLTGSLSPPVLTINSYTPAGTVGTPTFSGTATALSKSTFDATAPTVFALTAVGGSSSTYTPQGTVTAPAFTGTPATLTGTVSTSTLTMNSYTPAGTISASTPRYMDALPYYRL